MYSIVSKVFIFSLFSLALLSCRKDELSTLDGEYTCSYHYQSEIEGEPQSKIDTSYTTILTLLEHDMSRFSVSGLFDISLVYNPNGDLVEDNSTHEKWTGRFVSNHSFNIERSQWTYGHFSYHQLDCNR